MSDLLDVLETIERVVADDFCEDLDCIIAFHPKELSEREKTMVKKLSQVYRLSHSWNSRNSCYHVHENWRKEAEALWPREEHQ